MKGILGPDTRVLYSYKELPIGSTILGKDPKPGMTGNWRVIRPILADDKCIFCGKCWKFCPESSVKWKQGTFEIDYEYCKGCGICSFECPVAAIKMIKEEWDS